MGLFACCVGVDCGFCLTFVGGWFEWLLVVMVEEFLVLSLLVRCGWFVLLVLLAFGRYCRFCFWVRCLGLRIWWGLFTRFGVVLRFVLDCVGLWLFWCLLLCRLCLLVCFAYSGLLG